VARAGGSCWWLVLVVGAGGWCWWLVLVVGAGGWCWWLVRVANHPAAYGGTPPKEGNRGARPGVPLLWRGGFFAELFMRAKKTRWLGHICTSHQHEPPATKNAAKAAFFRTAR